ncbi:OmpA family protein [bacterium]|nr:OmpA family protein [bacterium]
MKYQLWLLLTIVFLVIFQGLSPGQSLTGVRPNGMGGAFTAISNDANALEWNPAGIATYRDHTFLGDYSRLYWGVDNDNLNESFVGYVHHLSPFSAGLSFKSLFTRIYRKNILGITGGREILPGLSAGLRLRLIMDSFNQAEFSYVSGEDTNPEDDPVFDNGMKKTAFTIDAGALMQPLPQLQVGLSINNIIPPDMALNPDLNQYQDNSSKETVQVRLGLAYDYKDYFTLSTDAVYNTQSVGGESIGLALGIESWKFLQYNLGLRTGIDFNHFFSAGFSYLINLPFPLRIDYSFLYPISELGKAGMNTHKIGLSVGIKPKEKLPDLIPLNAAFASGSTYVGEPNLLSVEVGNQGQTGTEDFIVALYEVCEKDYKLLETKVISGLSQEKSGKVEFVITAETTGENAFSVMADDNGERGPERPKGEVREQDESNNSLSVNYLTFENIDGKVILDPGVLVMNKMLYINEEEAIVPVIYFEPNKADVDPRYYWLLELMAERLKRNTDAVLIVKGFYHPETDDRSQESLSWQRAQNVKERIIEFNPGISDRVRAPRNHDPAAPRISLSKYVSKEEDIPLVYSENRRVELEIDFKTREDFIAPDFSEVDIKRISTKAKSSLQNNPLAQLIVLVGKDIEAKKAYEVKSQLLSNLPPELGNRVFFSIVPHDQDPRSIMIQLRGEEILYRAKAVHSALDYEYFGKDDTDIKVSASGAIERYRVDILDLDGNVFVNLGEGDGEPPSSIRWDWKDSGGNLISADKSYIARLELEDVLGSRKTIYSQDTLNIEVKEEVDRTDRILIVQFIFNEAVARSRFFVDRLEYVANLISDYAQKKSKHAEVIVEGHTDITGLNNRNLQLSDERSLEVFNNLMEYIAVINGLESPEAAEAWLKENDVKLKREVYSWEKPYKVNVWRDGELQEILLGNNDFPEGRTINRRVIIQIKMEEEF